MKSQATQTDVPQSGPQSGKSLPHLAIGADDDQFLSVQDGKYYSGPDHRKLYKSLSEAPNTDTNYDMYQNAGNNRNANQDNLLKRVHSFDAAEDDQPVSPYDVRNISESSDVFMDASSRSSKKSVKKVMSDVEVIKEKRNVMAAGYVDVTISNIDSEEDIIESHNIEESQCSLDFSQSRIFSQESLIDEPELEEESYHETLTTSPKLDTDTNLQLSRSESPLLIESRIDDIPGFLLDEISAISPSGAASNQDSADNLEESFSESQVTVIPSNNAKDSSNHISNPNGSNIYSDVISELNLKPNFIDGKQSMTNVSITSDDAASGSDTVTYGLEKLSHSSTSSEQDRAIASSTDDYSSIISGDSFTVKSDAFDNDFEDPDLIIEENYMEKLVQELKSSSSKFSPSNLSSRQRDVRKIVSPESGSFRKYIDNEFNNIPDALKTNSDPSPSENSDDFVTANDNNLPDKSNRNLTSVAPQIGRNENTVAETTEILSSDFETAHDMTSSLSESTTSANNQIEDLDKYNGDRTKPLLPPKGSTVTAPAIPPKPGRFIRDGHNKNITAVSTTTESSAVLSSDKIFTSPKINQMREATSDLDQSSNDDSRRFSRYFDGESNTTEDSADNQGDGEDSDSENLRDIWSEEEREKIKMGMKLDFPGSMYGGKDLTNEKKTKDEILKKLKKTVKAESSNKISSRSPSQSPKGSVCSQSPSDKRFKEKSKAKPAEDSAAGMVRSPAMHEGFRLQDWTPVRTPGTPDKTLNIDTSDDSGTDHSPRLSKARSPNRPTKEGRKKLRENQRKADEASHVRIPYADPRNRFKQESDKCKATVSTIQTGSFMKNPVMSTSLDMTNTSLQQHQCDYSGNGVGVCGQCVDRPASREGILGSSIVSSQLMPMNSSHHQHYAHQMYVMQKSPSLQHTYQQEISMSLPRPKPIPIRARSEDRNVLARDWYSGQSLDWNELNQRNVVDDEVGINCDAYKASPWLLLAAWDELRVWRRDNGPAIPIPPHVRIRGFDDEEDSDDQVLQCGDDVLQRRGSNDSTCSEKDFRRKYQAVTHRLVHRKASIEMYRRLTCNTLKTDKTVVVSRASGEFGFRIHGSRPVVVSAIEFGTPAETSGLEVGDIVLTINGVNVLDLCHAEVVKLASSCGRDNIHMEVARTCNLIAPLVTTDPTPVCAGYLYKLGTAHRTVGSITRRWHRRWFTLTKDNCLYHYKSESDPQPLGAVVLRGHTVHAFSTSSRPFAFTLSLTGEVGLQLAAHSAESRARWGHVITQAAEQAAQRDELLELSSRRVQQAPGSIATPDCFGYLYKLGARWHQWRRRYCVLKDACLFLYQDTQATQAIGVIYLHGYRVQSTSIGSKRNAFELLPSELRFKHLYFHSDSENDKKRWLSALEYSIDRWIKLG